MKRKTPPYLTGRFFDGISSGLFMLALPWLMLATPNMGTFVALTALLCTITTFLATPYFSALIDRHSRKKYFDHRAGNPGFNRIYCRCNLLVWRRFYCRPRCRSTHFLGF